MGEVEQNIDAYRIVFEILNDLRSLLRRELERVHGRDWPRSGLPRHTLERLIERKEKEKAIDWYETEYQELTDFAGFEDLLQILEHNSGMLAEVRTLAPSPALLHARFLELEVMCSKLGLARPISENELSFLGTFHLRFRRALEAQQAASPGTSAAAAAAPSAPADDADADVAASVEIEEPDDDEVGEGEPVEDVPPVKPVPPPVAPVRPPTTGEPAAEGAPPPAASESLAPPKAAPKPPAGQLSAIDTALENNDHRTIFRELYREVMELAEALWTTDVPGTPRVWDRVRVSEWYELNFTRRGLKPLSDFYEVLNQVWEKMHGGMARDELQDFLKRSNFAQLLLSLRDMFQKNQV